MAHDALFDLHVPPWISHGDFSAEAAGVAGADGVAGTDGVTAGAGALSFRQHWICEGEQQSENKE